MVAVVDLRSAVGQIVGGSPLLISDLQSVRCKIQDLTESGHVHLNRTETENVLNKLNTDGVSEILLGGLCQG